MQNISILIVEDEMLTAVYFQAILQDMGCKSCDIAANMEQALESYNRKKPDLVLMDIRLAREESGIDVARKIQEIDPEQAIIFMTGYIDDGICQEAMKLNPLSFINKPIIIHELNSIIDEYFG